MTSELRDAKDSWPDGDRPAQLDLEEQFRPLLEEILTHAHRSRDTPLRFGIDSDGIVNAALKSFLTEQAVEEAVSSQDWETAKAVFDALLKRALLDERERQAESNRSPIIEQSHPLDNDGNAISRSAGVRVNKRAPHPLAAWLERFYTAMRDVHPNAIEIAKLRMENYTSREVAQQLGLGLRLVKRIIEDVRLALEGEVNP